MAEIKPLLCEIGIVPFNQALFKFFLSEFGFYFRGSYEVIVRDELLAALSWAWLCWPTKAADRWNFAVFLTRPKSKSVEAYLFTVISLRYSNPRGA